MFKGYATKAGSLGTALIGIGMIISEFSKDVPDMQVIKEGFGMITIGLATFGIGRKIDRQ